MIKNELRYKGKILSYDEKTKVISNITINAFLIKAVFTLLMVVIVSLILMVVLAFINTTWASISLGTMIGSLISTVIGLIFLEREVISKELNDKLYIYFDLLSEFIQEDKSRAKINMIIRKLTRYLGTLENNVNNVFIFRSSNIDVQLVQQIKKVLLDDLIYLIKRGNKETILDLISGIKDAYLSAEGLSLTKSIEPVEEKEHNLKIDKLKDILIRCENEKQILMTQTNRARFAELQTNAVKFITSTYALTISLAVIAVSLLIYMNYAGEYSILSANISVVSIFVTIIIFIIQSRNK
ncbi:hypothetical protein [Paenibacillus sp. DR312]|uniref:hypothetical protein n=1 Tax=Paenibacillus sp. DR312 TaxID=2871175 RepID=UPI001C95FAE2|nr:hypothetical protein [Paenibacillus sp. DR312]QZN77676.1 hypothetical protein K5K90_11075 [Paenibacillus sp. DR312]